MNIKKRSAILPASSEGINAVGVELILVLDEVEVGREVEDWVEVELVV